MQVVDYVADEAGGGDSVDPRTSSGGRESRSGRGQRSLVWVNVFVAWTIGKPAVAAAEGAESTDGAATATSKLDAAFKPESTPKQGSPFSQVSMIGTANVISGDLTGEDGGTLASGGVGFVGMTPRHWTVIGAFTFGNEGTGTDNATAADYVTFLHVPTSALGVDLHIRWLAEWRKLWLGWSVGLRGSHQSFGFGDGNSESINAIGIDPSAAGSIAIDEDKGIYFVCEAGLAARFWNRPSTAFVDALDITSRNHAFFGFRGLTALNIGNIHVGVEFMRLWGGDINALKEFAIIPYVGFRGGLAPSSETPGAGAKGARRSAPPPPTPVL
jgi:hypothetical protein